MLVLSPSAYFSWVGQRACRKTCAVWCVARVLGRAHGTAAWREQVTFEVAGIRPGIVASLRAAFPDVQRPTPMQEKLISAMSGTKDVVLQDYTGSGKSFAVMLALLNKPRGTASGITTLLVVPHRDLAFQYLHWIRSVVAAGENDAAFPPLPSIAKVLVRGTPLEGFPHLMGSVLSPSSDLSPLRRDPPHILIGTPTAIMDVILRTPECLQLKTLSAVVVDEADALLEWVSAHKSGHTRRMIQKRMEKHPMVLHQIMDALFTSENRNRPESHREALLTPDFAPARRPQLVMLSATMRHTLRNALHDTFGWLKRGHVVNLVRAPSPSRPAHALNRTAVHHVLVVSEDGTIANISGARPPRDAEKAPPIATNEGEPISEDDTPYEEEDAVLDDGSNAGLVDAPLMINPAMLEAVASTFALDVPHAALLVLPATAPVRKVIFELRQLGVDAHSLDLLGNGASRVHSHSQEMGVPSENPTLLVSTLATTRGVDFPALSHVFLLGIPSGRSGDAYLHIAGRVGRFGRQGKVVTLLEARSEQKVKKGKVVVKDEPKRMSVMLRHMGIEPTKLGHF